MGEFEKFLAENSLTQINSKCTRHRLGQRSSLLDIFVTNVTLKCSQWENLANLSSEHQAVKVLFRITERIHKQQFMVIRNTKELNAKNITDFLSRVNNFEDELEMEDVNQITDSILEKM